MYEFETYSAVVYFRHELLGNFLEAVVTGISFVCQVMVKIYGFTTFNEYKLKDIYIRIYWKIFDYQSRLVLGVIIIYNNNLLLQ